MQKSTILSKLGSEPCSFRLIVHERKEYVSIFELIYSFGHLILIGAGHFTLRPYRHSFSPLFALGKNLTREKKNLGESSCSASPPCHVKTLDASTVWKDAQKELCLKIVFSRYTVVQYTALLLTLLVPYTLFPILLLSLQLPLPNNFSSYLNKFQSFSSKITVVKTVFFFIASFLA